MTVLDGKTYENGKRSPSGSKRLGSFNANRSFSVKIRDLLPISLQQVSSKTRMT